VQESHNRNVDEDAICGDTGQLQGADKAAHTEKSSAGLEGCSAEVCNPITAH
jgi:hypothetical protein